MEALVEALNMNSELSVICTKPRTGSNCPEGNEKNKV